ncbi:DNA gyrase subunit A [bacterium]
MARKKKADDQDSFLEHSSLNIMPRSIEEEMKNSYMDYAMSVIVGRALPDVRDGLKPVHRRILYAMKELGLVHNKAYKKSATVVGDVLGKYHPHGDMAVYDTMVRMVQDFSLRYPLIDGQGNFGSIDGDRAAAYRYTEVRMADIAEQMLKDIDKDTVEFTPNFDGSQNEPRVLPSVLPNLLINGTSGIAVGMATNIPPHNLEEVVDGVIELINNPDIDIKKLNKIIKGPDFPTGATICGRSGIVDAYNKGRGSIRIRANAEIEPMSGSRESIIVTELPYQVNKANLLITIANLVKDKKINGISDLRDESNKEGIRVVIELKRDENAQIILNQLYKHTQMETSFGVIMLALVNNRPKILNLLEVLEHYRDHRVDVTTRRIKFELKKAEARAHILEGLRKAIDHMDAIIKIIRASKDADTARTKLMEEYSFTKRQAQAILDMRLHQLTALEREKLDNEYNELQKFIKELKSILLDPAKLMGVIKEELVEIRKKYGDKRRTQITSESTDIDIEDLITEENVVVTISHSGYVKRLPATTYRAQHRGGRGITGMTTKEEDFVKEVMVTSTHAYVLFFTNLGRLYWLKVYEIPEASRIARGKAIVNLLHLSPGEKVTAVIPIRKFIEETRYLIMVTKLGNIKKTALEHFSNPRKKGIIAISLEEGDTLVDVKLTDGAKEIVLATRDGQAIHFREEDIRPMGRGAKGVRGIRLTREEIVIGMDIVEENGTFLVATENGYGKRTKISAYRTQSRGGKGVINIKTTERNGKVIGVRTVHNDDEIILITQNGMIIRQPVKGISVIGRNAQGVRLIKIKEGDRLVSMARVKLELDIDSGQKDLFKD